MLTNDISILENNIKKNLLKHLKIIGFETSEDGKLFCSSNGKNTVRLFHLQQKRERLLKSQKIFDKKSILLKYFASGEEIVPENIRHP